MNNKQIIEKARKDVEKVLHTALECTKDCTQEYIDGIMGSIIMNLVVMEVQFIKFYENNGRKAEVQSSYYKLESLITTLFENIDSIRLLDSTSYGNVLNKSLSERGAFPKTYPPIQKDKQ